MLGGDDFDHALIVHLASEFEKRTGIDVLEDPIARQRMREAAETAKRELSTALSTSVHLPFLAVGESGPLHMEHETLERPLLERLVADLLARLEPPCRSVLADAGLRTKDIDQVLLVGGMTRMPAVQSRAGEIFGREPSKCVDADEVVAVGAATQAAILSGELEEVVLLDVTSHSLGIRTKGDYMSVLIPRNTSVPASMTKLFRTTMKNQEQVVVSAFQGESSHVTQNTLIGELRLVGLPPGPAGSVQVEVTFTINADGILEVSARDVKEGKETSIEMKV
jgi:molecular chaperone DnaK